MSRQKTHAERKAMKQRLAAAVQRGEPCYICGQPIDYQGAKTYDYDAPTIDHIKPWRDYPELRADMGNLAPTHRACNSSKGVKQSALPAHGNASRDWSRKQ